MNRKNIMKMLILTIVFYSVIFGSVKAHTVNFQVNSEQNTVPDVEISDSKFNHQRESESSIISAPGLDQRELALLSSDNGDRDAYALCVGVENYPGSENDLDYCADDAYDVRTWFVNEFDVPSGNTQVLTDYSATTSSITTSISNFASLMDENDYLFFSFSGHGSGGMEPGDIFDWEIESPHNYNNNYDHYWHYNHPGAELMRVHFTKVDVELNYDVVWVGDYHETEYAYDYFTGYYTDVWSNWVLTDDIYVELYTDISDTDWGFKVDKVQIGYWGEPFEIIPNDGLEDGISGLELDSMFDGVPGTIITVLDSCFSGSVGSQIAGEDRYILTGGTDNELTLEDSGYGNGLTTYQFLHAWNTATDANSDSVLSFEEIFPNFYSGTVSRSTSLGYVHHPDEYDGVSGQVILNTNAEIISYFNHGSGNIDLNVAINGLGYGQFGVYYYDATNESYYCPFSGSVEPTGTIQNYEYSPPSGFLTDVVAVRVSADYNAVHDEDEQIINYSGIVFNVTDDADSDTLDDLYEFNNGLNPWDNDTDSDTLEDAWEILNGLDPSNPDTDFDGLDDGEELNIYGTDPLDTDSDDDTMFDGWEVFYGLNATNDGDKNGDPDLDTVLNYIEHYYNSSPLSSDTDGDTMGDLYEINHDLDPVVDDRGLDYDEDSLTNFEEFNLGTLPNNNDTDTDLLSDGDEVNVWGSNPFYDDSDLDGLLDGEEVHEYGSNPTLVDTDSDTLGDFDEVMAYGTNPSSADTDNDGVPDPWEIRLGTNPCSNANSPLTYVGFIMVACAGLIAIPVAGNIAKKKTAKKRGTSVIGPKPSPSNVEKVQSRYSSPSYSTGSSYSPRPSNARSPPTNQDMKKVVELLLSGICPACGGWINKTTLSCSSCYRNYVEFYRRLFGGK